MGPLGPSPRLNGDAILGIHPRVGVDGDEDVVAVARQGPWWKKASLALRKADEILKSGKIR